MNKIIKVLGVYLAACGIAHAALDDDLNNYFDHLVNNPKAEDAYKAQAAGYYGGGEIVMKNDIRDLQIMHIDLPNFTAGCGGIDLFKGGFSMINSQDLIEFFKATLSNALGYSFTLAMESATPEIANVMKYLKDMADKINQTNFNSCEMAEGLVGSLWDQVYSADRHICAALKNIGGAADYASARQACGVGGQLNETLQNSRNSVYKNFTAYKMNITWSAAQQSKLLHDNQNLAELAMALVGATIFKGEGKEAYIFLSPLASVDEAVHALLYGGAIKVYRCNDDTCLDPEIKDLHVANGLAVKVTDLLNNLKDSMVKDTEPSVAAKGLLQVTSLPVLAMIKAKIHLTQDSSALNFTNYADIIASDVLFQYLRGILSALQAGSNVLQLPDAVMEKLHKNIAVSLDLLHEYQSNTYSRFELAVQMTTRSQADKQALESEQARRMRNHYDGG